MALPFGLESKDILLLAIPAILGIAAKFIVSAVRPARRMVWIDRSATRLADLTRAEAGGLSLMFNGREIKQATVRTIRVQNVGKEAARAADIEKPVRIEVAEGAALLNASISAANGIAAPNPTVEGNAATLPNLNWSKGDWADVQIVYEGVPSHGIIVEARIVDFPPLRRVLPDEKRAAWMMIGVAAYVAAVMAPMLLAPAFGSSQEAVLSSYMPWMMGLLFAPMFGFMVWNSDPIRILRGKAPKPPGQHPRL